MKRKGEKQGLGALFGSFFKERERKGEKWEDKIENFLFIFSLLKWDERERKREKNL